MPRTSFRRAAQELAARDPVMARLIELGGPVRIRPPRDPDHFVDLAETIVYQQLAGAAARAIWGRVAALFDGAITPQAVLAVSDDDLRAAGLSRNKTTSMRDLAARVADGTVPLDGIRRLKDDEIVDRLSQVRGIGRWTAEMFLIFQLRRPDVWPVDDYGVRKGYAVAYGLPAPPPPKQLHLEGERFRPYRTTAAWYLWRAVDLSLTPADLRVRVARPKRATS
jgi:3-methyladenine DNA glycosylase/8-oxoguanine DNA glycosylase